MLRVAVVGLGKRSQRHAIPYFLGDNTSWQLAALCANIFQQLLASNIHVLKEKPAAMTALELESFQDLARSNDVTFNTASHGVSAKNG